MNTWDDEGKPIRMAFDISSERVNHYADVVEYMTSAAIAKFVSEHKRQPSPQAIAFYKKEVVRYATLRKDLKTANELKIQSSTLLKS